MTRIASAFVVSTLAAAAAVAGAAEHFAIATLVEVTYEPSGANTAHRHPCPVIGYVLEGRLRMQKDKPARSLAYCDRKTPLSVPATVARQDAEASR